MSRWSSWPHGRGAARGWAHDYGVVHWGRGAGHVGSARSRCGWACALCPAMALPGAHRWFTVGRCARSRRPLRSAHVPLHPLFTVGVLGLRGSMACTWSPGRLVELSMLTEEVPREFGRTTMVSCTGGGGPGTLGRCDRGVGGLSPSALRWPLSTLTFGSPSVGVLGPAAPSSVPTSRGFPSSWWGWCGLSRVGHGENVLRRADGQDGVERRHRQDDGEDCSGRCLIRNLEIRGPADAGGARGAYQEPGLGPWSQPIGLGAMGVTSPCKTYCV